MHTPHEHTRTNTQTHNLADPVPPYNRKCAFYAGDCAGIRDSPLLMLPLLPTHTQSYVDADPLAPYNRKCAFDAGDYGLGFAANSLALGCDCLGVVHYWDGVVNDSKGEVGSRLCISICLFCIACCMRLYMLVWYSMYIRTTGVRARRCTLNLHSNSQLCRPRAARGHPQRSLPARRGRRPAVEARGREHEAKSRAPATEPRARGVCIVALATHAALVFAAAAAACGASSLWSARPASKWRRREPVSPQWAGSERPPLSLIAHGPVKRTHHISTYPRHRVTAVPHRLRRGAARAAAGHQLHHDGGQLRVLLL